MEVKTRNLVSSRVSDAIAKHIKKLKLHDDAALLENAIEEMGFKCPMCNKLWPKECKPEQKTRVSVRIDEDIAEKVNSLSNSSHYLNIVLQIHLGICPICNRDIAKK